MALQPWQKGIVIKIVDMNPSTKRFWVQVSEIKTFDFVPGQFVTLDLPIHEKANKRLRSYSLASAPNNTNVFELCVETNQVGLGATYLFSQVQEGSELIFRGPVGVFTIPSQLNRDIYLICESTGVVPFRSMLQYIASQSIQHQNIYLIYGGNEQTDLLYHNELVELQNTITGFYYLPVLSNNTNAALNGNIHLVYSSLLKEKQQTIISYTADFFICGWKEMVDTAKATLLELGIDKKDIRQELYG